jgi:DNA processing protein
MHQPVSRPLLSPRTLWALQTQLTSGELTQVRNDLLNHHPISLPKALKILHTSTSLSPDTTTNAPALLSYWDLEALMAGKNNSELPLAVATQGNPEILNGPKVAIIGSRHPTYYGREQAHRFAHEIAKAGITIVSGGAIGIDTIANQAAFDAGKSCAILGSGIQNPYPTTNQTLFKRFSQSQNGLVISEFPHDQGAVKWNFPRRNRTIAALADFLLVIEATLTSGSILTVNAALEMNCDIGALPGPLDAPTSEGTNRLIRDGAFCILRPSDVIERVMSIAASQMKSSKHCQSPSV